ncbi:glutamine amidotransferase-related protein [Streptococcus panodentis]|uniref:Glutamine amidotransferase n=1 Tax=Streptococcus panodentis TaxID=1581472 RepID=A0ABS5AXW5_9STRE|nr:gamma-glutamyl-gamma-aminobutyrate hydrolase family protein [Streptococcus panodentis]MBP2621093.1 glutamine amidotransferase [Streptococcus panodentis]
MRVHFVLHESFEAPGAYLDWAQTRGHEISMTKVYQSEQLPQTADAIDFLIVMGGPQSPDPDLEAFPYYHPEEEIKLIRSALSKDRYILGICLGAQLLSQAYGAQYEPSPEREIGNYPIELTAEGLKDQHLQHLGEQLVVGHWHGDMPGLVQGAQVLAASQGCPRQIVRFSPKHYAFQAHLELTHELVELLIAAEGREALLAQSQCHPFIQTPEEILHYHYAEMNEKLGAFLDSLTESTSSTSAE